MNPLEPKAPEQPIELTKVTYSIAEAAEVIGVSYHTVSRLIKRRKLRALPGIRHKRIPHAELQRFLREL